MPDILKQVSFNHVINGIGHLNDSNSKARF
jgi:hypothetical protein